MFSYSGVSWGKIYVSVLRHTESRLPVVGIDVGKEAAWETCCCDRSFGVESRLVGRVGALPSRTARNSAFRISHRCWISSGGRAAFSTRNISRSDFRTLRRDGMPDWPAIVSIVYRRLGSV